MHFVVILTSSIRIFLHAHSQHIQCWTLPLRPSWELRKRDLNGKVTVLVSDLNGKVTVLVSDLNGKVTVLVSDLNGKVTVLVNDLNGKVTISE